MRFFVGVSHYLDDLLRFQEQSHHPPRGTREYRHHHQQPDDYAITHSDPVAHVHFDHYGDLISHSNFYLDQYGHGHQQLYPVLEPDDHL